MKLNKKNLVTLGSTAAIALTMTTGLVATPTAAQADTRGTWEGVAIAGALLGGYGLAQHNSTDAVIGGAAAIVGLSQLGGHDRDGRNFGGTYGVSIRQDGNYNGYNNYVAPARNDDRDNRNFDNRSFDNRDFNAAANRGPQRSAGNNFGGGWNR